MSRHPFATVVTALVFLLSVAGNQSRSADFPKETGEVTHKSRDTTAYASAKVSHQGDAGLIELKVRVKKTGANGKGFAYGVVALLDNDNNTVFKTDLVAKHKGASALKGVAHGETWEDFHVPLDKMDRTAKAMILVRAEDKDGFDDPIGELQKHLDDAIKILKHANELKEEYVKLVGF